MINCDKVKEGDLLYFYSKETELALKCKVLRVKDFIVWVMFLEDNHYKLCIEEDLFFSKLDLKKHLNKEHEEKMLKIELLEDL